MNKDYISCTAGENNISEKVSIEQSGKYTIKGDYGHGGMGKIILGYDETIGRDIVIKELVYNSNDPELKINDLQSRFLKEARISGQLQHPSIIPVYEIGKRENGSYYYTMKLVRGKTLTQAIRESSSLDDAMKLFPHFRDLCHAVEYAHSRGVIHRDIKPDNIMIGEFGETVVLDWGLAKVAGQEDERQYDLKEEIDMLKTSNNSKTIHGQVLGTPSYMSPEQAMGDIDHMDQLSDIYSLGAVLYEILTGHEPFRGKNVFETISKVINEPFERFEKEKFPPPKALQAIVNKALQKKKERRYQTVEELVADVEAYMSGEKVSVHTYSTSEMLNMFIKQHKAFVISFEIILMIIFLAGVMTYQQYRKAIHNEKVALQSLQKEKEAVRISKYHYSQALLREAKNLMNRKDHNSADIYAAASLLNNPSHEKSGFYSSDFKKRFPDSIYFRTAADSILYQNAFDIKARLEHIMEQDEAVYSVAFSTNEQYLLSGGRDQTVHLWDAQTGKEVKRFNGHTDTIYSVVFSPNDKYIISGSFDQTVRLWSLKTGKELQKYEGHAAWVNYLKLSPDENYILSSADDQTIRIWNEKNGEQMLILPTQEGLQIDWAADGNSFVLSNYKEIQIWPFERELLNRNPEKLFRKAESSAGMYLDGFQLKQMSKDDFYRRKSKVKR